MEKRRFARMDAGSTVFFTMLDRVPLGEAQLSAFSAFGDGSVTDISKGGFHVEYLNEPKLAKLKAGDRVGFRLHIPTGPIEGIASVEWLKPDLSEMGFVFDKITNDGGGEV